jgi:tRNA U38,U39,U40 pseudouridine synthase TruA
VWGKLIKICLRQQDTLAEQGCVARTDDDVHAAAMLLSAYRAGEECRLSQADAS